MKIFCKHKWEKYYSWSFNDENLTTILSRKCLKCGKVQSFEIPIENATPIYEHYQKLKKEFRAE